jgi:peptidoglycan/LPS O-acetylase OafA/YrhL
MSFGAGVMYAIYKEEIEAFVRRWYWAVLIGLIAAFMVIPYLPLISRYHFAMFNMKSVAFALIVVLLTMKFEIRCPVFAWCGEHLFPLYIYQRIPMMVFSIIWPAAFADLRSWIFCGLSGLITVSIALLYNKFQYSVVSK